jgi:hypothetical protein
MSMSAPDRTTHDEAQDAADDGAGAPASVPDRSQVDELVALALGRSELFHNASDRPFFGVDDSDGRRAVRVDSGQGRRFLQQLYRDEHGRVPSGPAVTNAIEALAGEAIFGGPEKDVPVRVARAPDATYVDLGAPGSRALRLSQEGWSVTSAPPIHFRRKATSGSLPDPVRGGSVADLRPFLNLAREDDFVLTLGFLLMAFHAEGPYPVLVLQGEQGSAKTTAARVIKSLVDPAEPLLRSLPRSERDLGVAADGNRVLAFDNLGGLPPWVSDAFCRLSTGGGIATRQLYSDDDEVVFDVKRLVILNGLDAIASRQDLLDRAVVINLPKIMDEARRPEGEFWASFEEARPRILGALATAACEALRRLPEVRLPTLPRMADFAKFVTAAEPALGLPAGSFLAAHARNRSEAMQFSLDGSPVAKGIMKLLERHRSSWVGPHERHNGSWEGTPTQLLDQLAQHEADRVTLSRSWPANAQALSRKLTLLAPALREAGVEVDTGTTGRGNDKTRWVELRDVRDRPGNAGDAGDAGRAQGT